MTMNKFFNFYPPNHVCQRTPLTEITADGELCQTKQLTSRLHYEIIQGVYG